MFATSLVRSALIVFALAIMAPAMAADLTFTGQVTWRERMALPPDASLTVTLVSLPNGQRVTGAHASLGGKAGSPIQFTLNVRSEVIANGGDYGLVAEIQSGGYPIFTNGQPVAVDPGVPAGILIPVQFTPPPPHPAPQQVLPPPETPNPMLDIVWSVTSIGGDPVLPQNQVTLSIAADHRVGGSGGCNSYFAAADFSEPPLSFSPVASTKMACDQPIMEQETHFFAALGATASYELVGDTLKLFDAAGVPLVCLVRQD